MWAGKRNMTGIHGTPTTLSLSTFVHKWNLESNQWVAATRENKFFFSRENWGKERDGLWQMCGCVNPWFDTSQHLDSSFLYPRFHALAALSHWLDPNRSVFYTYTYIILSPLAPSRVSFLSSSSACTSLFRVSLCAHSAYVTLVSQCWLFFFSLSFSLPPRLSFLSRFLCCLPRHDLLNLLLLLLLLRLQLSKCRNLTGECVAVKVKQPHTKKNNLLPVSLFFIFFFNLLRFLFFFL